MNSYRCLICGETYIGKEKPSHCPFCGAKDEYLVDVDHWVDENLGMEKLSDVSRGNLEKALQLEMNNAPFYRDAMSKTRDMELQGIFKYLSKIEAEHASVIIKILKGETPRPEKGKEVATGDDRENLRAAHAREIAAAALYKKFAEEAVEPRVKTVFTALSEIESDHISIEDVLLEKRG